MADETLYQKGLANRARVFGTEGEERRKVFEKASPDFARSFVTEQVFGVLYERKGIGDKTREAVILAILIARGMSREIEYHVHAALNVGMTRKDIEEIIMVCAYYAGGPHAVAAIHASLNVFKERGI